MSKIKNFEIRVCKTIGELGKIRQFPETYKFTLDDIDNTDNIYTVNNLPISLENEKFYTISNWTTNYIIKGCGGKSFEVMEHYGSDLKMGEEYMLICPVY